MSEKVSIITASYNYDNLIPETIESVLNQTYQNWEMIIVDDGSKDNSVGVIKSYCEKDNRIKLYQHENGMNRGLAETLKLGISKAESDWIIFLESDDTIREDYIEKKLEIIKKYPDIKFIYNDVNLFGDEERIREFDSYFLDVQKDIKDLIFPVNISKYLEKKNIIPTFSCAMLKKESLDNVNFNPSIMAYLDWYLWSQIACKNEFYFINEKLTNWRIHKKSYICKTNTSINSYLYFVKCQIKDNLQGGKYKFINRLNYFFKVLKQFRKNLISIHINRKEISLKILNRELLRKKNEN